MAPSWPTRSPVEQWHDLVGGLTFGDAILDRLLKNTQSTREHGDHLLSFVQHLKATTQVELEETAPAVVGGSLTGKRKRWPGGIPDWGCYLMRGENPERISMRANKAWRTP